MSDVGITDGSSVHLAIYSTDQVQLANIWCIAVWEINFQGSYREI